MLNSRIQMNPNGYSYSFQTPEIGNYSSPTASFSSNGSSMSQQDMYHDDLEYRLTELEKVMMETDHGYMESFDVSENDTITANWLTSELRPMVSLSGEPAHRLGAYMLEGLVARLSSSGSSIYNALKCKQPSSNKLFSYMCLLYEACPYFKFGYLSANGAIAEATKNESRIHIIDFQIAQGSQWVTLIQALASRPGGEVNIVGQRLTKLAQSCNIPFEFHGVSVSGSEIETKHLGCRPGESLAVNFSFMLHHIVTPQK
ncbi:putative transcription factor GRAS family [Helianthus anomalus]